MSEIIHKTEPIEHWIVDGKAYRLATEKDVGKMCYRSNKPSFEEALRNDAAMPIKRYIANSDSPFVVLCGWRYAYIQDNSLLAPPQPTEPLPTKPIDWTKPVRTKDGRAVRVLCTDGPRANYPVIGIIKDAVETISWTLEGTHSIGHPSGVDLENVPQRIQREYWVNVYEDEACNAVHPTREEAKRCADDSRLACVKITIDCEEGEGL